jgi:hypothetical protein
VIFGTVNGLAEKSLDGWLSVDFSGLCVRLANLDLAAAAQVLAFAGSSNVTFPLLKDFPPSVENCLAISWFRYCLLVHG